LEGTGAPARQRGLAAPQAVRTHPPRREVCLLDPQPRNPDDVKSAAARFPGVDLIEINGPVELEEHDTPDRAGGGRG
jgi:hypothetical protein